MLLDIFVIVEPDPSIPPEEDTVEEQAKRKRQLVFEFTEGTMSMECPIGLSVEEVFNIFRSFAEQAPAIIEQHGNPDQRKLH